MNKLPIILLLLLFNGCIQKNEYQTQPSGLLFKLNTIAEENKRIQAKNYVQFKIWRVNKANKVISEKRLFLQIPKKVKLGGVMEALSLLNEKETGSFRTKTIMIEPELKQITKWTAFNGDSLVSFNLLIDKIYTETAYNKKKQEFIKWISSTERNTAIFQTEMQLINEFIQKNELQFNSTSSGLKFKIIKSVKEDKRLKYGDHVAINYAGSFLNGTEVINTFDKNELLDFFIGQELQVIKGMEEALLLMNKGEKIALIIPSWLAFGSKGSSNGLIPPNTPVYYEMEVY